MPTNPRVDAPSVDEWIRAGNTSNKAVWDLALRQIAYLQSAPPQEKVTGELRRNVETLCNFLEKNAIMMGPFLSASIAAVRSALAKCETTRDEFPQGWTWKRVGPEYVPVGDEVWLNYSAKVFKNDGPLERARVVDDSAYEHGMIILIPPQPAEAVKEKKCLDRVRELRAVNPKHVDFLVDYLADKLDEALKAIDELRKKP